MVTPPIKQPRGSRGLFIQVWYYSFDMVWHGLTVQIRCWCSSHSTMHFICGACCRKLNRLSWEQNWNKTTSTTSHIVAGSGSNKKHSWRRGRSPVQRFSTLMVIGCPTVTGGMEKTMAPTKWHPGSCLNISFVLVKYHQFSWWIPLTSFNRRWRVPSTHSRKNIQKRLGESASPFQIWLTHVEATSGCVWKWGIPRTTWQYRLWGHSNWFWFIST